MVTRDAILKVAPAAAPYVDELLRQMQDNDIATPRRAAHFLGQIMVESNSFKSLVENLNYSADGLANTWPSRYAEKLNGKYVKVTVNGRQRNKPNALAMRLARKPEAIANNAYADRMGNGNEASGEGWKYRGRGLKMVTGANNIRAFSRWWLGTDELLRNPDRIAQPDGAVASAIWFWMANKLNPIADRDDVTEVTQVVNGGDIGLAARKQWTAQFRHAFA